MASMITNLPPAPLLTDARGAFDAKTAAFTQALPAFGAEANALAGEVWALYAAFLAESASPMARSTSATSMAIRTGAKAFTVLAGKGFVAGQPVLISSTSI